MWRGNNFNFSKQKNIMFSTPEMLNLDISKQAKAYLEKYHLEMYGKLFNFQFEEYFYRPI